MQAIICNSHKLILVASGNEIWNIDKINYFLHERYEIPIIACAITSTKSYMIYYGSQSKM